MTLIAWDIGTKKMKDRTSNVIVDDFFLPLLTFLSLECCTSIHNFRIRENS